MIGCSIESNTIEISDEPVAEANYHSGNYEIVVANW